LPSTGCLRQAQAAAAELRRLSLSKPSKPPKLFPLPSTGCLRQAQAAAAELVEAAKAAEAVEATEATEAASVAFDRLPSTGSGSGG